MYINYNFNIHPCGRTYYEINKNWKNVKFSIKKILDDKYTTRVCKIDLIISILENYKNTYNISKERK